jgi:hypothetical protein
VERVLKKAGVYEKRTIKLSEKEEQDILESWNKGESQLSISRRTGLSQSWIGRFLRKKGIIPQRPARENHSNWKGGRQILQGYTRVLLSNSDPYYPMASHDGYVMEHRLVMAKSLNRLLSDSETVHHINGKRSDNRIENLQLRRGKHGKGVVCRCANCGSENIIEVSI